MNRPSVALASSETVLVSRTYNGEGEAFETTGPAGLMTHTDYDDKGPDAHRRWLRFSLRPLLVMCALVCVVCAWLGWNLRIVRERTAARTWLAARGGSVEAHGARWGRADASRRQSGTCSFLGTPDSWGSKRMDDHIARRPD